MRDYNVLLLPSSYVSRLGRRLRLTVQMARQHLLKRWTAFNLVGAAGVAVQLATIALLVRIFDWHYLSATAVAVEAAILHNFVWHQRWTWKDRPAATWQSAARRLVRFHALNGAISLAGNVLLMSLLTGVLGLDPILANGMAIVSCSLLNFAASELMVFRWTVPAASLLLLVLCTPAAASEDLPPVVSTGPGAQTLAAWRSYEATVDGRYNAAPATGGTFFVLDRQGARGWREAVATSGTRMLQIETAGIPDGKIHHWVGAVFVPGVTLETVLERLKRYAGRESEFYDDVVASKLLTKDGDRIRIFMKLRRTVLITVTYNTEHAVEYRQVGSARASARSVATKIAELRDVGTPKEREKPPDEDSGYLWRLNAYWRYEAVAGGVLVECESVSLSKSVPWLARPIANPIVDRIARDSLERTLRSLRKVLVSTSARTERAPAAPVEAAGNATR
jgi:putative flippase GtrA